jgi:hypothetical protein
VHPLSKEEDQKPVRLWPGYTLTHYTGINGSKRSPFQNDDHYVGYTYGNHDIVIERDDGAILQFNTVHILMAMNGFYQDGAYRLSPASVIDFFNICPDKDYTAKIHLVPKLIETDVDEVPLSGDPKLKN